jgi:hypothetical protein
MKRYMAFVIVAGLAASASAQVSNFLGGVEMPAAPTSLDFQAFESNSVLSLIAERSGYTLQNDLTVNAVEAGHYDSTSLLSDSVIPAGTRVNSWIFHNDAVGVVTDWANSVVVAGGVTFDHKILGVMVLDAELDASDAEVGLEGVMYPISGHRGMELDLYCPDLKYDAFTIDADRRTFSMLMHTDRKADQIRIITEAPPLPAPGAAAVLIGAGLMAGRRRR